MDLIRDYLVGGLGGAQERVFRETGMRLLVAAERLSVAAKTRGTGKRIKI